MLNLVKKIIVKLVKNARNEDKDRFDYGTTTIKDINIEINSNGITAMNGYVVFSSYHIEITAKPIDDLKEIDTMF